jgi:hypothetical protein
VKRLRRILLNVATALSLLLCCAALVAWPVSPRKAGVIDYYSAAHWRDGRFTRRELTVFVAAGGLALGFSTWDQGYEADPAWHCYTFDRPRYPRAGYGAQFRPGESRHSADGIGFGHHSLLGAPGRGNRESFVIVAPLWFLAAGLAVLPGVRLVRSRRRRARLRPGHCPACGYDLRATPDRCPECGREAT